MLATNNHVDDIYSVAGSIQQRWANGTLHSYDIVESFIDELVANQAEIDRLLPRLNILVTPVNDRFVEMHRATSKEQLADLLIQTTHIPFVTGELRTPVLDGGFSRVLHPSCEKTVSVPGTLSSYIHTLNPGLGKPDVLKFWHAGRQDAEMETMNVEVIDM